MIYFRKGRALNKVMAIGFGVISLIFCIAGLILFGIDFALGETLFVVSKIIAGFALIFVVLWAISSKNEAGKQQLYTDIVNSLNEESNIDDKFLHGITFDIPKAELLYESKKRLVSITLLCAVISIALAVIWLVWLVVTGHFNGYGTLFVFIGIMLYFPLFAFVIQFPVYLIYVKSIPERIRFSVNSLEVDSKKYIRNEISFIEISSAKRMNANSINVYRYLCITSVNEKVKYLIDFRGAGNSKLRYADYDELVEVLDNWCRKNNVALKVNYMD